VTLWKYIQPTKLKALGKVLAARSGTLDVLDVGCGNNSPTVTRHWLKDITYTGVDIAEYNIDFGDKARMDRFVLVNEDGSGYEAIPDASFDVVILNHVVEHMRDPAAVLTTLCRKLRRGGYIYVAFPSVRSLAFPPCASGTLNFCDDPTHIRIVDVKEVAQTLLDNDVKIIRAGRSSDPFRYVLGALLYPWRVVQKTLTGRMNGSGLWHFLGFEDMVLGQLRP
jgi:2-polyprenyl-3-methyl-5-hydroxy-6-metoxy-1,4-benzoquinol methylase